MNTPLDPDAALVHRLVGGDLEALGLLYQRHGGAVRTLLRRAEPTVSADEADDLCQETFLTFHQGIGRYRHVGRLRAWLYGIALKKAKNHRRKGWWRTLLRREQGEAAAGVALRRDDPEARASARERVGQILAGLPPAQREVLVLTALEGLSVQDAAGVLGVSENAVSTRLYRARRALKGMG